jgi:uncharacterized protein
MAEFIYQLTDDSKTVELIFNDLEQPLPDLTQLKNQFKASEFSSYSLKEDALKKALSTIESHLELNCHNQQKEVEEKSDSDSDSTKELSGITGSQTNIGLPLVYAVANARSYSIDIEISDSKMEAFAFIKTAQGGNNPTTQDLLDHLRRNKVTFGLLDEVIESLIEQVDHVAPGTELKDVVAKGCPPGEPEPYQFINSVTPFEDRILEPQQKVDGSIDMKNLGDILTVTEGTELVRRVKGKSGVPGHNILNELISARIPERPDFGVGDGTAISADDQDVLVAIIDGVPLRKTNGMRISDALVVKDVDIKVGNINYDGNVLIMGNVQPGMSVKAKGDVIIDGYVESASITAMGDVLIKQGIIGRPIQTDFPDHASAKDGLTCKIMALGNISALYAQYAFVQAKGDVDFGSQLLNSFVIAKDHVRVGVEKSRKSRLVGGHIFAGRTVQAGIIGSNSFVSTHINLGDDIEIAQKVLNNLQAQIEQLIEKKAKLDDEMETLQAEKLTSNIESKMIDIDSKASELQSELSQLTQKKEMGDKQLAKKIEMIKVNCWANLFPGSYLTVGKHQFKAESQFKSGSIGFNQNKKLVFTQ